jgi:hypothetical protein
MKKTTIKTGIRNRVRLTYTATTADKAALAKDIADSDPVAIVKAIGSKIPGYRRQLATAIKTLPKKSRAISAPTITLKDLLANPPTTKTPPPDRSDYPEHANSLEVLGSEIGELELAITLFTERYRAGDIASVARLALGIGRMHERIQWRFHEFAAFRGKKKLSDMAAARDEAKAVKQDRTFNRRRLVECMWNRQGITRSIQGMSAALTTEHLFHACCDRLGIEGEEREYLLKHLPKRTALANDIKKLGLRAKKAARWRESNLSAVC